MAAYEVKVAARDMEANPARASESKLRSDT